MFAQASGNTLPIVTESDDLDGHVFIAAGRQMRASNVGFRVDDLGPEDLRIVVRDRNIGIAGGRPRGTLYGVYTFLEDYLGVRFLTRDHTHVPPVGPWRIIGPVDRFYHPPLESRWSDYGESRRDRMFAARLRCNVITRDPRLGGVTGRRHIGHSFLAQIPSTRYGEDHPEYYGLINRKRLALTDNAPHGNQPCLANPDVLRIVIEAVVADFERDPGAAVKSVSQNDNSNYCRCGSCAAIDEREGCPMGSLLTFVNTVADEVARRHPGARIGTLSYQYSRKPPRFLKPRPNVQIQLCSIECSVLQPMDEAAVKVNAAFADDLRGWARICQDISIWTYNTNFRNYLLPCPNLRVIEPNIRFFVANNVRGIYMQGAYHAMGAEFSELRNYVTSRLLWDPNQSGAQLIEEFARLHYRSAARPILRFINLIHDNAAEKGIQRHCFGAATHYGIDDSVVRAGLDSFEEARRLADDEVVRARVEKASVCAYRAAVEDAWLWVEQNRKDLGEKTIDRAVMERTRPFLRRLFDLCETHGVNRWNEGLKIEEARRLLEQAFGMDEGESF